MANTRLPQNPFRFGSFRRNYQSSHVTLNCARSFLLLHLLVTMAPFVVVYDKPRGDVGSVHMQRKRKHRGPFTYVDGVEFAKPALEAHMVSEEEPAVVVAPPADVKGGVSASTTAETVAVSYQDGQLASTADQQQLSDNSWTYTMALARKNAVSTFEWTTTDPIFTPVLTLNAPLSLLTTELVSHPFNVYAAWSGDIELVVELAGNQYFYGMLGVFWVPYTLDYAARITNYTTLSQLTYELLDASKDGSVTLTIPYSGLTDFMMTAPLADFASLFLSQMGTFYIIPWEQLAITTGAQTSVTVNVYVRFPNIKFKTPNPNPSTLRRTINGMRAKFYGCSTLQPQGNTYTTNSTTVGAGAKDIDIPTYTTGSTISPSLSSSLSVPKVPKLDRPLWPAVTPMMLGRAFYNVVNSSIEDIMDRMSMYSGSQSLPIPQITGSAVSPMAWDQLLHRWCYTEDFLITSALTPGFLLSYGAICPVEQILTVPPSSTSPLVKKSILDNYASEFLCWQGDIELGLMFIMSGIHTVKVRFSTAYYSVTVPAATDQAAQFYHDITVNGSEGPRCFSFTMPFISPTDWKFVPTGDQTPTGVFDCSCGSWSIRLLSALTYTDQVQPSIRVFVFQRAGKNMRFYGIGPASSMYTAGFSNPPTLEAQGFDCNSSTVVGPANIPEPAPVNRIVSEVCENFVDLLRRPCAANVMSFVAPSGASLPTGGESFISFHDSPLLRLYNQYNTTPGSMATPTGVNLFTQDTISAHSWTWLKCRGSIRYFFRLIIKSRLFPSGSATYDPVACEIEWIPQFATAGASTPRPATLAQSTAQYHWRAFGTNDTTYGTPAGTVSSTYSRATNGSKIVLTPQMPQGALEPPFSGIYTQHFSNQSQLFTSEAATVNGHLHARLRYPAMPVDGLPTPCDLQVFRVAGDDFTFSEFLGFSPSYLMWSVTAGTKVPMLGYTGPAPFTAVAQAQGALISKRRRVKVIEVEDSDSDESIVVLRAEGSQLYAQAYNGGEEVEEQGIKLVPKTVAHFLHCFKNHKCTWADYPSALPPITFGHNIVPEKGEILHMYSLSVAGHIERVSVTTSGLTVQTANVTDITILHTLVEELYKWAVVNANTTQSIYELLEIYTRMHNAELMNINPYSSLNQIRQNVAGTVLLNDLVASLGPPHARQHTVMVRFCLPDGRCFCTSATSPSLQEAKRMASAELLQKLPLGLSATIPISEEGKE
jgi:hypothetical protein